MFATGTNWSIVIDFLAPVKALARHETGTRPARTSDCLEAEAVKKCRKQKCRNLFFLVRNERRGFFSQAPCISQAPFHVPIRGGYRGGARLSKMDCSDTTQSLQVSLEGRFKKSFLGLNVGDQELEELFLVSPQNTSS